MAACLATCNTFPTYMLALQKVALYQWTGIPKERTAMLHVLVSLDQLGEQQQKKKKPVKRSKREAILFLYIFFSREKDGCIRNYTTVV